MDYKNNTYDAMLKQKKDMLDTYSNLADESFKNKGLNEQEFNLRTGRKIDNFYIDQEVSKQNEFDLENASEKGYELIDDSKAVLNKFRLRTDSVKIQQFDNAQKKRMSSSITLYKRQHEMVMRDDGLEEYDFEIGEKTNDKTFLIMVGIHNWGQAQLVKKDYGDHLMTNEFYRKHREMIDSLAPDLELDAESKKLDGRNIFGDVGFTEESVNALRKFYEGLQNNMGATLYDAVLASMYRLDTFDSASLGPDAVPQKFMETKALRDRMGAVGEFISLGVNAPGEIGSAIRRLKGYSEHNLEDPNNPNQAVKYAKDTDVLNYYFEICDHMHMALDSDLRSALEDGKITFNEATGFIHQVDEKGHLTNLGEQGTRLSAFYHIGRSDKNLRGKMSSQVLEEHRKKNITKEGSNAEIEHNRYLSMYMDSIYFNSAQKPDLGNDGYGITKTVLKLQATNKEKYDQNKEMIDNMVEDVKGLSASIDAVNNQMEFYKKLQEDIAKDSKDPAVLKFKNNPNLMAYVNIHLDNKRNNLLKLLARADGYLNAFTNIFLNNELSVEGMNIINQYNDENKYIDMSKSAVHIRKISQYYSLRNEERNNMILDKIKKKLGKDLTEDKEKELKLWIAGKQGELAINKLGLEGVDFYDVSADDLYDKLKPYSGILNGGEALSEDKILEDIPGKIIEITKEFQEVFNSFFGKINEFHFGVIKQNEVQNTMDQFIALHLKYDSLNKILARENGNLTLEDKIKQDIKENAGDKAVFEYDKNRKLINKQFTIVEDLLYEYRMGEVIKKIEMGAPIDSLYTQGEYNEVENNDIVGVIRLFDNRIKKNKRNNVVYARRDKKTLSDHVKKYYAIQCKRTNNSINNLVGGYKENEATTEKGNIYDNNLKLFTSRLRGYVSGSKETEQEEFGSESKALEAILSKKKKVNEEKKEDNNKENELEQNKNEKKEINIEDFEIIENEEKEEEKEEKEEKEEEKEEIEEENEEKDEERAKQEFAKCEKLISKYKNITETNKKKYNEKLSGESKLKENKKERLKILVDSQNKLADLIVLKDIAQMKNIRDELMKKENKTVADEYLISEYSNYINKAISVTGQENNIGNAPDNIDLAINDAEKTLLKEIVNSVVVGYDKETEKSISNLREELEKGTFIDLSEGFQTRLYTFVSTYYADSVQVKEAEDNKEQNKEEIVNKEEELKEEEIVNKEEELKEEQEEKKEENKEKEKEEKEENEEKDVERAKQEFAKCEKLISKYKNISETNKKKYNKKLSGESKIKENKKERLKILIDSQNKLADLIVLKDIGQMINIRAELMGKENKTAADEYLITEYSTYISKAISVTGQKNNMGQAPDNIDLAINDAEKTLLKEIVNSVVVGYDKETEKSISNLREELEKGTFIDLSEGFQTRLYTFVSTYYSDSVQVKEAEDNKEQNKEQEPKEKQKANKEQIPKAEQEFNEYIEKLNNGSFSEKILAKVITEFQAKSVMNSKTNEILQKVNGENDKLISRTNSKEKFKRLLVADKITDIVNHAENLISSKRAEDYNYEEELDYINSSSFIEAIAQVNNGKIEDSDNFNINDQDKKILEIILDSINVDEAWTEESMVDIQSKMESGALEPLSEGVMNRLQAMMICYNISKQKSKNINVIKKNKINIDDFEVIEGEKKEEKKVEKKEENKKDEEKNEKNNNEEKKKDLIDEFDIIKDEEIKEVKKNQIIYNKDKFTDMGKTYGLKVEMPKDIVIKDKNSAEGIAMAEQIKNAEFMKNVFLLSSVKQFKNDKYWKDFVKKEPKTTWRYSYIQLIANGKVKLPGTKTIVTLNYNVIGNKEDDNLLKNIEAKDREAWAEFVKDPLKIQTSNGRAEVLDRMFKDPKFKGLETKKGSGAIDSVKYAGFMALYTEYIGNMISFQDKFRRNTLKEMHTQQLLNVKPINMNDKEMKIAKFDNFENQKLGLNCFAATGAYILNYWNKMKKEHAVRKTRTYTQDDFKSDTNLRVRNLDIKRYIQLYEKKNTLSEQQLKLVDWDLVNTFKEEYDNLSNYLDPEVSAVGNLFQLADMYLGHLKNVCVKKWNTQAGSLESIVGTDKEKQKKLYELLKIKVSEIMKANGNTPISFFRGSQAQNNSFMTSGHYVVITGINAKGSIMYYEPAYKIGQEIKEPLKEKELKPEDLLGLGNELELQWLEEMNQEQVDKIKKDYDMMGSEFEGNKLKNYEKVYEENMLDSANMIHNKGIVLTKKASKEESIDSVFGEAVYVPITLDDEEYQKVVRGVGKKVEDNKAILAKGKKSTKAKKVIKKKSDK
ncbi:MAG: hypothetical protein K6B41_11255 [Butyrivibrio sp.]|nr:hypothetical protein [Butyrivibrio sp.]